jgi:ABC-type sulfate transport system substrate-binding protein
MFAVKHKTEDRYLCGTSSRKADHDHNDLVSFDFARIYPTERGAQSARSSYAGAWDHEKGELYRDLNKYDLVEVVEIKLQ